MLALFEIKDTDVGRMSDVRREIMVIRFGIFF